MLNTSELLFRLRDLFRGGRPTIEVQGKVIYRLPPALSNNVSCLMFTQPKSGSKMVRGILRRLARQSGLQPTGPGGSFFAAGISQTEIPGSTSEIFRPTGYFYHFSNVPAEYDVPSDWPALVHVRDIRDILVSKYYSLRTSHPEPGDGISPEKKRQFLGLREALQHLDVNQGVLRLATPGLSEATQALRVRANKPATLLSRYEDMVYRKLEWAKGVCNHFGWDLSAGEIARAVQPFDVLPQEERADQHLRQVHPGNFRKKLSPKTIEKLNQIFGQELKAFGYPLD